MTDKKIQGKKNRQAGARFELKVRKDLESKGWIIDRWTNNVEIGFIKYDYMGRDGKWKVAKTKLIPRLIQAKSNRFNMRTTGFPDFVIFKNRPERCARSCIAGQINNVYEISGIEVKSNGYLDKIEKEKCKWLLDNNIFSKILIASKGTKRGQIVYKEFENV